MRLLLRLTFALYAAILFIATHWPKLRIESRHIPRPDILIHMTAFGLWTLLLIGTGVFAPESRDPLAQSRGWRGWVAIVTRPRAVFLAWVAAMTYAAFDELTQGVPGLGRTVAWDDFAANCAGIVGACGVAMVVGYRVRRNAE